MPTRVGSIELAGRRKYASNACPLRLKRERGEQPVLACQAAIGSYFCRTSRRGRLTAQYRRAEYTGVRLYNCEATTLLPEQSGPANFGA